jgi:glucose-1-phosphate adenylyltransferase
MELLKPESSLCFANDWPIYGSTKSNSEFIKTGDGRIVNSIVSHGCTVKGYVENSILSPGVYVDEQAEIVNSVVMDNTYIGYHSIVDRCILDENVRIDKYCYLGFGAAPVTGVWDVTMLGKEVKVPAQTAIGRKCKIPPGLGLDAFDSRLVAAGTILSATA